MAADYTSTLNLPKTDFSMRANLPQREPEMLKADEELGVYAKLIEKNAENKTFILNDGPPSSNGYIHMGHALNKILKDFIIKYKAMTGYCTPYVPGWDNHGMPIESAIIKKNKEDVTKKLHCFTEKKTLKAIEVTWANKLIQYQYSIYNNRSSADFPLLFDTAIADALILGPLRTEAVVLPDETLQKIKAYGVNAKTERLMITLAEYYIANKEPDSDWVIIPRTNISAYLGSASYVDNYEKKIPEGFMEKKPEMGGVSAVRINL